MKKAPKKITKKELKANEMYKKNKKKEEIASKLEQKLAEQRSRIVEQYSTLKRNSVAKITKHYDDKLAKRLRREEIKYEKRKSRQIKVKVYKKEVKAKQPTETKMRLRAKAKFCEYCKLARAKIIDGEIMIWVLDIQKRLPLDKGVHAGHYRPAYNFPQLAFIFDNCQPISYYCNKAQGDNIGTRWKDLFLAQVGNKIYDYMEILSNDKESKNEIRGRSYYQEKYIYYSGLVKIEKQRLGIECA